MTVKKIISLFISGFKDSIYGPFKFFNDPNHNAAASSPSTSSNKKPAPDYSLKLRQRLLQSCVLNGVFLFLCIIAFNYLLMPFLNWMTSKIISNKNSTIITDYMNPMINLAFSFVWILPVFLLSKIFNLLWHQDIADIAYLQKCGRPKTYQKFTLAQVLADTIFSGTMDLLFVVECSLINLLPFYWLTHFLCQVHLSFLYSLYAFEYKWCNKGWGIRRRIYHIETRWPYFIGFGLSLSLLLSFINSYIISATLFASIFPAYIISAIESDCEKLDAVVVHKKIKTPDNFATVAEEKLRLPLFRPSLHLTNFIYITIKRVYEMIKGKPDGSQPGQQHTQQQRADPSITLRKTN